MKSACESTPYGRAFDAGAVNGVVGAGDNFVSVDVRARGDSEGTFLPFVNDGEDGHDTIEWVAAQPSSNGRVGTDVRLSAARPAGRTRRRLPSEGAGR